ncbi:hypothetical protein BJ166DRAFT_323651 [Pestalotiopsis sp. NC0098]|nr:hypothetical protein BJ166DRAFT_323651 [Pestalotiopsis sp. NC0098]
MAVSGLAAIPHLTCICPPNGRAQHCPFDLGTSRASYLPSYTVLQTSILHRVSPCNLAAIHTDGRLGCRRLRHKKRVCLFAYLPLSYSVPVRCMAAQSCCVLSSRCVVVLGCRQRQTSHCTDRHVAVHPSVTHAHSCLFRADTLNASKGHGNASMISLRQRRLFVQRSLSNLFCGLLFPSKRGRIGQQQQQHSSHHHHIQNSLLLPSTPPHEFTA